MLKDEVRHILAGCLARTAAQCLIHPLDTIKTRLQVRKPLERLSRWRKKISLHPLEVRIGGMRFSTRNFLARGVSDLYLGLGGAIVGTVPTALVYFSVYERTRHALEEGPLVGRTADSVAHLLSASAGALTSALIRVPTDNLKHRVQAYMYPNIFVAARDLVMSQGMRGLYSGMLPTLYRDVPELAVQFALYEALRKRVQGPKERKLPTWQHLGMGAVCGAAAASLTMPLDVIKTVQQCSPTQLSMAATCRVILADKGLPGLFSGMTVRVAQTAIMSAAFFAAFEFWKAQLKPNRLRDPGDRALTAKLYLKKRDRVWKRQFTCR